MDKNDKHWDHETILATVGDAHTAPTAMVCVWIAAVEVLLAVLLEVLSARAKLSKAVKDTTTMSRNIATLFSIS